MLYTTSYGLHNELCYDGSQYASLGREQVCLDRNRLANGETFSPSSYHMSTGVRQ